VDIIWLCKMAVSKGALVFFVNYMLGFIFYPHYALLKQ
jgi:hypothetical protein